MKRLLLAAALLLTALLAHPAAAQDLLTRRDGTEVLVKVLEITPELVKYHRFDNPDGPLISVRKTDVFRIKYANGTQEILTPLPPGTTLPATGLLGTAPAPTPPLPAGGNPVPGDELSQEPVHLSGPRLGFTVLTDGVLNRARDHVSDLNPFMTQFGWQFESRLFRLPNGVSGLVELVPLVGGLEQGKFIPSVSGLLGLRGPNGLEFGLGPNVTPLGADIVLAVGTSFRSNGINFPINLAVVPGHGGARISLLIGFNSRHN
ncbi:hypothetical protein E4631_14095 [Hymenobacter sp. UV11]|uniref:hypothetical protein n=1 Tax=Hymenobacter sp. UV11 TaxID=1849735 RepID=UPI00105ECEF0|nr:hypothetical protein [Hymenobacter sp. UV11]TDN36701.1 hypothetical protein A8B98_08460 [Hymenobacter sp. UV11]TFZ66204.1 hypothetical protein E4631_14095 [Hymenobacter sp. UV11]